MNSRLASMTSEPRVQKCLSQAREMFQLLAGSRFLLPPLMMLPFRDVELAKLRNTNWPTWRSISRRISSPGAGVQAVSQRGLKKERSLVRLLSPLCIKVDVSYRAPNSETNTGLKRQRAV